MSFPEAVDEFVGVVKRVEHLFSSVGCESGVVDFVEIWSAKNHGWSLRRSEENASADEQQEKRDVTDPFGG